MEGDDCHKPEAELDLLGASCLWSPLGGVSGSQRGLNFIPSCLKGPFGISLALLLLGRGGGWSVLFLLGSQELLEKFWLNPSSTPLAVILEKY